MFDTFKTQIVTGILSGIVLLFLVIIAAATTNTPDWVWKAIWWMLTGCSIILFVLGIVNYRKGETVHGIVAIVFSLLWFLSILVHASVNWSWSNNNFGVCVSGDLSSITF